METWKEVPNYEGLYEVSNEGRVKSLPKKCGGKGNSFISKERILKNRINSRGYYMNTLTKEGKPKHYNTHQIVTMAFLDHVPNGYTMIVDHINNSKLDNRLENLQIVTNRENCSKDSKRKYSKYVGVSYNLRAKKYTAKIRLGKKNKTIGYFSSEHEAHLAYQRELKKCSV